VAATNVKIIQRKKKNTILSGWNVHRLVMIVIKNSSGKSNEETRAVVWIKKRKLYISAFGACSCSYNNIDMLL